MIHSPKRLNRRNQPRVDFLVVSVPSRASEEIHRSKRSTMSRGGGWIRFGEICLTDHRSYGVRWGAIAGYKVAGTVTYVYRAVRKPALRNERSAIGLLPCPLRSFISILLSSFSTLPPVCPCIRLCPSHSTLLFRCQFATRFTAGSDSDACVSDKNLFCPPPRGSTPIDPINSTIRSYI